MALQQELEAVRAEAETQRTAAVAAEAAAAKAEAAVAQAVTVVAAVQEGAETSSSGGGVNEQLAAAIAERDALMVVAEELEVERDAANAAAAAAAEAVTASTAAVTDAGSLPPVRPRTASAEEKPGWYKEMFSEELTAISRSSAELEAELEAVATVEAELGVPSTPRRRLSASSSVSAATASAVDDMLGALSAEAGRARTDANAAATEAASLRVEVRSLQLSLQLRDAALASAKMGQREATRELSEMAELLTHELHGMRGERDRRIACCPTPALIPSHRLNLPASP